MKNRQILNIVNFIRAVEPRAKIDLLEPVVQQIRLMKEHRLRGTFLIQYDALLLPEYTDLLKSLDPAQFEIGVWFEIVQPQAEAAGLTWTGRFPWDWHAHCGFSVGYTKREREALVDVLFEKFREVFGDYPRVFGSWFFDSHTARYVAGKYPLDAMCNCKEQYGTDGYTLWGGYYGQGYYPSRTNVFMPAQTAKEQISVPIFRMLGSDPVYQYDYGMSVQTGAPARQGVITLEPVCGAPGGGQAEWVDWFLRENFNGECLSFGYAQAGQENSFGWPRMGSALQSQFERFDALQRQGKIIVEPLGETGRFFKKEYPETPASVISAHSAFDDAGISSVWYSCKNYRVNLYCEHGKLRLRDLHVFCERFPDPFEDAVCEANEATYETLPVIDGNRHSGNGVRAGGYLLPEGNAAPLQFTDLGGGAARADYGTYQIILRPDGILIRSERDFTLEARVGQSGNHLPDVVRRDARTVALNYRGTRYALSLEKGSFAGESAARSEDGELHILIRNHLHS